MSRYLYRRVPDDMVREDIVQEAVINACRYLPEYQWTGSLTAWLFTIAYHAQVNYARAKATREMPLYDDDEFFIVEELPDARDDDFAQCLADDMMRLVLDNMPPAFKETARLIIGGAEYADVSMALGMGDGTVKSQVHRMRKYARRTLAGLTL